MVNYVFSLVDTIDAGRIVWSSLTSYKHDLLERRSPIDRPTAPTGEGDLLGEEEQACKRNKLKTEKNKRPSKKNTGKRMKTLKVPVVLGR